MPPRTKWEGIERRVCDSEDHKKLEESVEDIHEMLIDLKTAFPNGDFDGHRRAHEAMIKAAEAQERFWENVKLDVVKKGVWGTIVIVVSLIIIGAYYKLTMFMSGAPLPK